MTIAEDMIKLTEAKILHLESQVISAAQVGDAALLVDLGQQIDEAQDVLTRLKAA